MSTKEFSKESIKEFLLSILAGMSISFGCVAFLASNNKIVGSLFFVVGLFMILNFSFSLFTGKVCYSLEHKPTYILRLVWIWLGNIVGALFMALLVRATRLEGLFASAQTVVDTKLNDNLLSLFGLGILCNIMIFLAVYGYKNFENILAKMVALFFGVSVFVLCGFEHCIADAFYFSFCSSFSWEMILRLVIITLGNAVGGLLIPVILKLIKWLDKKPEPTQEPQKVETNKQSNKEKIEEIINKKQA